MQSTSNHTIRFFIVLTPEKIKIVLVTGTVIVSFADWALWAPALRQIQCTDLESI